MTFNRIHSLAAHILLGFVLSSLLFGCADTKDTIGSPLQYIGSSGDKEKQVMEDHLKKIEQRIDVLERDFRAIEPNIQNLVAIESDIQTLVTELSKLTDPAVTQLRGDNTPSLADDLSTTDASIPDMAPDDEGADTAMETNTSDPPTELYPIADTDVLAQNSEESGVESLGFPHEIVNIRFGDFNAGTRLVVDFAPNSEMNYDITKDNGDIVISFDKTDWAADKSWSASKQDLITGYTAKQFAEYSTMRITTNGDDMTVKVFTLPPVSADKGPRLVLDFNKGINS